jgi:hypothetical protein
MMANLSGRWGAALMAVSGLALSASSCKTALPEKSLPAPPERVTATSFGPTLMADVAPISALAHDGTYLWVGSARGLRRIHLGTRESEWIGPRAGFTARQVTALAADGDATVWVGTELGIGVVEKTATGPRYRALVELPGITRVVPIAATPERTDAWVGTETGLVRVSQGAAVPVELARGDVITFLDPDSDGKSVWVGLRARGLLRVDPADTSLLTTALTAVGPGFAGNLDFVDPLGTTLLPSGTRVAYGRAQGGGTRLVVLSASGPVLLVPQPEIPIQALVQHPYSSFDSNVATATSASNGDFIAGPDSAPTRFQLAQAARGEALPLGAIRFLPVHRSLNGIRLVARPIGGVLGLGDITVALAAGAAGATAPADDRGVFIGTRSSGTARVTGPDTIPLPSGELALGATGLSVMCVELDRCFVATGTGTGWTWTPGSRGGVAPLPAVSVGGRLMALAGDGTGATFSVSGDPGKILRVARLSADGARFDPVVQLSVDVEGAAVATHAIVSPSGSLWITIRDRAADGAETGRGAIELQLPALRVIHHRPYTKNETAPAEVIPVDGDIRAIRFQERKDVSPEAIWFCTSTGILRFRQGELARWGENNGLDSEHCQDLVVTKAGTVWAATAAGTVRFVEQTTWRTADKWPTSGDGESLPARALIEIGDGAWAATPSGLWPLAGSERTWNRRSGLLDDDVSGLAVDRFSRLWSLGSAGVTVIDLTVPASTEVVAIRPVSITSASSSW